MRTLRVESFFAKLKLQKKWEYFFLLDFRLPETDFNSSHTLDGGYVDVSKNSGTHKSSILIGFSIINHPFWGTPVFGNTHVYLNI